MAQKSKQVLEGQKLQEEIQNQIKVTRNIQAMIKQEATRSNTQLKGKYISQGKKEQGKPFAKIYLQGKQQVYDDYNNLITKQFSQLLTEISKQLNEIKINTARELKQKNGNQLEEKINELRKILMANIDLLKKTWKEQTFLMCNYRMDIAAKEIERWELGLKNQVDEQKAKQEIDDLFK